MAVIREWIIAILIIILTLSILKDIHVEVYYRYCGPAKLQQEEETTLSQEDY